MFQKMCISLKIEGNEGGRKLAGRMGRVGGGAKRGTAGEGERDRERERLGAG